MKNRKKNNKKNAFRHPVFLKWSSGENISLNCLRFFWLPLLLSDSCYIVINAIKSLKIIINNEISAILIKYFSIVFSTNCLNFTVFHQPEIFFYFLNRSNDMFKNNTLMHRLNIFYRAIAKNIANCYLYICTCNT